MSRFAQLAIAAAVATFVLIMVGGLVRATDSGLGCPDWPLCFGEWVPPAELHAWIEHSHRLVAAAAVGPLVGAVGLITLLTHRRRDRVLLAAAVIAGLLVIVQAVLGGQVVIQGLRRELVTAHLAMALTVLALTILIADRAANGALPGRRSAIPVGLIAATGIVVFAQMLLGSWVTGHDAGLAFGDFPLMNGGLLPTLTAPEQAIQLAHRALALVVLALVLWMAWSVRRSTSSALPRRLAAAATLLVLVQLALGAANVWSRLSAAFVVPHLAVGAALFAACVWLLLAALRLPVAEALAVGSLPVGRRPASTRAAAGRGSTLRAYVALTKPRIIELLLVTTVPTMVLAERRIPSVWLMAAVVIGGTLAAGGANAINQFIDRDIDDLMRRTRHRPLPRHAVQPRSALVFGVVLSAVSFAWLTLTVNLLSALLAASAIAFYVFVYTLWLKRSTPQNIVIGGAAGCVPVLVAWAAVTGTIGVPALVLFAIVFYWTPPHFWALALRFQGDYAAANVPMLPVVRGEAETARQIVLYALLLVAVSLLLFPAAEMGLIYLGAAVVLGAAFLWYAVRLLRNVTDGRAAIGLFRFSISYLTLLFAAVAVDSLLRLPPP
ncbi:MAG TPA: heme o synthase [Candidatus Limnocylindrales bacterium]|nr:heme o synthase [Candidatus Limnocylindrales bacterium]